MPDLTPGATIDLPWSVAVLGQRPPTPDATVRATVVAVEPVWLTVRVQVPGERTPREVRLSLLECGEYGEVLARFG